MGETAMKKVRVMSKKQRRLLHSDYFTSIFNFSSHLKTAVIGNGTQCHMSGFYARKTIATIPPRTCKLKERSWLYIQSLVNECTSVH